MSATRDLLVELFVEELPPKALKALSEAFARELANGLIKRQLKHGVFDGTTFATPRRLAVYLPDVAERADDRAEEVKVMPVSVGLAEGRPTTALLKKLASLGADESVVPALSRRIDGKAETLFLKRTVRGQTLAEGLQEALAEAIVRLPIPKVMQYQLADGWTTVQFVRPAHGLVALHGTEIVPVTALGLEAGRTTHGHRFEAKHPMIVLRDAGSYAAQLRDEGAVVASFAERREEIVRQLVAAAVAEGLVVGDDAALLDEVTGLVERPKVLVCEFDHEFLEVPAECLVLTMKANQKYFPLFDPTGALTNRFLVVSNIAPADPSRVIEGNERVVRPRLADAKFFFDQDRRKTLFSRVAALDRVVYHGKLGSQGERVKRVQAIANALALASGAGAELVDQADRAALLAKADLLTDMVGEFPELQGTMGRYYALNDGEDSEVAIAIEDHYKPRFAGDELPRNPAGVIVALADKIETIVGLFCIGQVPTGDKDPFALRRHALGIVRLLIERDVNVGLYPLISMTISAMPAQARGYWLPPLEFIKERAKGYFEEKGFDRRAVDSVLGPHGAHFPLSQLPEIVQEAAKFIATSEGQLLAEANKRITNILKKSGFDVPFGTSPHELTEGPNVGTFLQDEERALFATLLSAGENALQLRNDKKFAASLAALIPLSVPTKAFFDKVMVNVDDVAVRDNRIRLLQYARAYMNLVADLTLMAR